VVTASEIFTPEEAQELAASYSEHGLHYRLAHTVATEPERVRAAVVTALREAARSAVDQRGRPYRWLNERADAIEEGADL
jgi:hypothetical protein